MQKQAGRWQSVHTMNRSLTCPVLLAAGTCIMAQIPIPKAPVGDSATLLPTAGAAAAAAAAPSADAAPAATAPAAKPAAASKPAEKQEEQPSLKSAKAAPAAAPEATLLPTGGAGAGPAATAATAPTGFPAAGEIPCVCWSLTLVVVELAHHWYTVYAVYRASYRQTLKGVALKCPARGWTTQQLPGQIVPARMAYTT